MMVSLSGFFGLRIQGPQIGQLHMVWHISFLLICTIESIMIYKLYVVACAKRSFRFEGRTSWMDA
jgi:hypothetical protein